MRRLTKLVRGHGAEKGATAVIAALSMVAIFAFAGLAIDLGASYAKHTELQNGADAAALALAQEYALDGCSPDSDMATTWVRDNVKNDAAGAEGTATCPEANQVKVVAEGTQAHWFMPVLGRDSSDLAADATVEWGSPVAGGAFPLTIARCEFEHVLDGAGGAYDGAAIQVWVPNTNEGGGSGSDGPEYCEESEEATGGYPPGGFGWLATDGECSAEYVDLDAAAPIVDGEPGNAAPGDCDWSSLIGTTVILPIFDEAVDGSNSKDYYVSEFASVEIVTLRIQTGSGGGHYGDTTRCTNSSIPSDGSWTKHCFAAVFRGYVSIDDHWEIGEVDPDGPLIIQLID